MEIIRNIFILFFLLSIVQCQVLKEPAAKVMSTSLPTPTIDSTQQNLPLADYHLQVKDLNNSVINMENYKGKIIFLNFWATWCLPCVAELPSIDKLYRHFTEKDIAFLLISNEDKIKVKKYHEKKGYTVPFHIIDKDGFIPPMYRSNSIPTTFIINKEGQIIKAISGAEDWDDEAFIKEIEKML